MTLPITQVRVGDVVRLKKPHPCGTNEWEVVRIGADIGLKCRGCERKVMLVRSEFDRRFRGFIERVAGDVSSPRDAAGDASLSHDSVESASQPRGVGSSAVEDESKRR